MQRGTKEHYELMDQFEKDVQQITYGHPLTRERSPKVPRNVFYEDGHVNELFHAYMRGYAYARTKFRDCEEGIENGE